MQLEVVRRQRELEVREERPGSKLSTVCALAVTDRWHPVSVVSVASCKVSMVVEKVTRGLTANQAKPQNSIDLQYILLITTMCAKKNN